MRPARFIKETLQALGCDVAHYRPVRSDPFVAQKQLLDGHACRTIFDVGAFRGEVTARYARLFPGADIYAFEPYPVSYESLVKRFQNNPRFHLVNGAVSSRSGESTFHVNQNPATNSLLPTGTGFAAASAITTKQITVPTLTLDDFRESRGLPSPEILKFDIQGNELEALRGAVRTLGENGPLLIYTEVLFESLYQNCALFGDLAGFLKSQGYELFNLYSLHHSPDGRLEFGDALFFHRRLRREPSHAT
jgi:FkbM family methyltransferase